MDRKRIAVLGAGPVGLEAALYAATLGHEVTVLEKGPVAAAVRRWGHVRLFTPWSMNTSALGRAELRAAGAPIPDSPGCPTGDEWVERYLEPLSRGTTLAGRVDTGCRVVQIGRRGLGKTAPLGAARANHEFVLLVERGGDESRVGADVVLDCSGCQDLANNLGDGGIPSPGEARLGSRLHTHLDAVCGPALAGLHGLRLLLVGDGLSAATAAMALATLDDLEVHWVSRRSRPPYAPRADDPLPSRARLQRAANRLAAGDDARFVFHEGTRIRRFDEIGGELGVELGSRGKTTEIRVDRVLGLVGYRPDARIYEELQVHQCYATSGPMALAATLLAGSSDCLAQSSPGAEALLNPEPDFHILGAKSYGRNSSFLYRLGLEQVRDLFAWMEGDRGLDLYAEDPQVAAVRAGDSIRPPEDQEPTCPMQP